jgi:dephospho-CoA kinase
VRRFAIGLTGGIGSGKTAVARQLAELGAATIDTDEIAHAVTSAGGAALPALRSAFGDQAVGGDGALDRTWMRELAFSQPQRKRELESLLHPLIREEALHRAQVAASQSPYLVFVVPLLVESGTWAREVDRVLLVDCSRAIQIERVRVRSQLALGRIESIIDQQATRAARLSAAADVLFNESSLAALAIRCRRLHEVYLRLAAAAAP